MFGSSQTLGFGATQGMSQTQTPEKPGRQEDKQTCVPTSVRLLLESQAAAERDGGELLLHGAEAVNITLVGVVEGLVLQATMVEFTLNDGSGRVKVRHYKNEASTDKLALAAGQYASVVGSIRTAPAVHVSAMSLRPVSSADEVSYHNIDVAHTALMMRSGNGAALVKAESPAQVAAPQPVTTAAAPAAVTPAAVTSAAVTPAAAASMAPMANTGDVQKSVLEVLQSLAETRPGGVPLTVMLEHLKSFPAAAVKTALDQLVVDGEAFTTIDDDHFSPL